MNQKEMDTLLSMNPNKLYSDMQNMEVAMKKSYFKCVICKETYDKVWSDELAYKEAINNFGVEKLFDGVEIVCDHCYQGKTIKINRIWAMPNKWTFTIKPIKQLLDKYVKSGKQWIDPFAGENSPAKMMTNDINPERKSNYHYDALTFLKKIDDNCCWGVLYDPPYSITQARMYGKKEFASMKYWAECKNEIARIIKPGGKVICFGWNSMGLGKGRGFKMIEILLVPHGGSKNDTIVTVEIKVVG